MLVNTLPRVLQFVVYDAKWYSPDPISKRTETGTRDGNWDAISIDSNPLLRRPSKLIASRFPTPKKHHAMTCAEMAGVPSGI